MSPSVHLRELQNFSAQQWLDHASRSLPQVVSALLVVAIAWQLVQLTWLLLERGVQAAPAPFAAAPARADPARKGIDIQAIVSAHLFGMPQAGEPKAQDTPRTRMNLVLSGVFAPQDPAQGLAIIGQSAQSGELVKVGQSIMPGTRLHEVYADRVILDRGGQLEALLLPTQSADAPLAINRAPASTAASKFADNLRHIAETNPTAFAQIVRPQPVFANGVQRGYRVYPGRNRQQFAKLGLQPGDLVTSINGTPLDDPQNAMQIFNTIGTSDRVNVTIERNGQTQDLTLNTAQITLPDADSAGAERSGSLRRARPRTFSPTPAAQ